MTTTLIVTNWVPGTPDPVPDQLIHLQHTLPATPEQLLAALHDFAVANSIGPVSWDWLVERIKSAAVPGPDSIITGWWVQTSFIQIVEEGNYL